MQLIKGKEIADGILNNIKAKIEKEKSRPALAVILIGEDEASRIYVGLKEKAAQEIGMDFKLYKYESSVGEDVVLNKIGEINADKAISGLIVQLPLPDKLDRHKIINAINPEKDVDGFCDSNQKSFFNNQETIFPVFPKAIMKMIESVLVDLEMREETPSVLADISPFEYKGGEGIDALIPLLNTPVRKISDGASKSGEGKVRRAVIVCMSDDFGKIMQKALEKSAIKSQYIFCDGISGKENILQEADIVVTACGKRNLINFQMVKDGAIIIDGGIVKENGKVYGDVNLESFKNTSCFISPVPGGVGPVTVACLLENTFQAYCESRNMGI